MKEEVRKADQLRSSRCPPLSSHPTPPHHPTPPPPHPPHRRRGDPHLAALAVAGVPLHGQPPPLLRPVRPGRRLVDGPVGRRRFRCDRGRQIREAAEAASTHTAPPEPCPQRPQPPADSGPKACSPPPAPPHPMLHATHVASFQSCPVITYARYVPSTVTLSSGRRPGGSATRTDFSPRRPAGGSDSGMLKASM
jgi:hypothetical protein